MEKPNEIKKLNGGKVGVENRCMCLTLGRASPRRYEHQPTRASASRVQQLHPSRLHLHSRTKLHDSTTTTALLPSLSSRESLTRKASTKAIAKANSHHPQHHNSQTPAPTHRLP